MHRRPHLSPALLVALAAVATLALAAGVVLLVRSRPVAVTVPPAGDDPACARFAAALPSRLGGRPRVATSSSSAAVAAWGDPAIIWRCGVTPPGPTSDACVQIDGVDWVVRRLDDGSSFTTYGRSPAVQVLVPGAYAPEPLRLPPLSRVVATLPQDGRRCT